MTPQFVERVQPDMFPLGQLHLIVWGPGHGEAMVLILPDGRLGIVDGCREKNDPVATFVRQWPVEHRIAFVCLTHPHDDHYAGLGRLIVEHSARIDRIATVSLMQQARCRKALEAWARHIGEADGPSSSIKGGLERFIAQLSPRTNAHVRISHLEGGSRFFCGEVGIESCSPSGNDLRLAEENVLLSAEGFLKTGDFKPNRLSLALVVEWKACRILLGGDLECGPMRDLNRGWHAAMDVATPPFQVIKAAHHGSHTGYHPPFWELVDPALTIVTPFKSADGNQPPRRKDLICLRRFGPVAVSSPPAWSTEDERRGGGLMPAPPPKPDSRLSLTPAPATSDNAVAVSLNADGQLLQLILSGQARMYDRHGRPEPPEATASPG